MIDADDDLDIPVDVVLDDDLHAEVIEFAADEPPAKDPRIAALEELLAQVRERKRALH